MDEPAIGNSSYPGFGPPGSPIHFLTMSETIRLYKYREIFSQRRVVRRDDLLARLEISSATLKRDLAKLRDQMHTPIVFDRDLGGYRIEATDQHELPGVWFTADELLALLTIQSLIVELMPSLLGPKLKPLQRKLNEMLNKQGLDPEVLAARIRLVHAGKRRFDMAHFETVARATIARKRLRIVHFNRERGERTQRDISPQQLVHYRDNWYVDAKCHLRREIRCFAIDAIVQAQMLPDDATEVDQDQLRAAMGASYGIFAGAPKGWARVKFSAQRARWVLHEQWHPEQRQRLLPDGSLELELPYSDERELLGDVLRFGADVQVLAPPDLRARFAAMVQAMQALLQTPAP